MNAPRQQNAKRSTLNPRITPELRGLIDQAAELGGKNRTEFVRDAARRAAEDALKERTLFLMGPEAYDTFVALLDAPPNPNERLRATLQTVPPH